MWNLRGGYRSYIQSGGLELHDSLSCLFNRKNNKPYFHAALIERRFKLEIELYEFILRSKLKYTKISISAHHRILCLPSLEFGHANRFIYLHIATNSVCQDLQDKKCNSRAWCDDKLLAHLRGFFCAHKGVEECVLLTNKCLNFASRRNSIALSVLHVYTRIFKKLDRTYIL